MEEIGEFTSKELEGELSDDEWELLYKEVQRRTDHQIEANQRLQERASQLLRLVLTTLGLALTAGSFAVSAFSPISFSFNDINPQLVELSEMTATLPLLHFRLTLAICFSLILAGWASLFHSASALIVSVPNNALKVLSFKAFNPGLSTEEIELRMGGERKRTKEKIEVIESYIENIRKNQTLVEESQKDWKNSYNSLWDSFKWLSLAIVFIMPFYILREPAIVLASTLILIFVVIDKSRDYISYEGLVENFHIRKEMDFGFSILTIYCYVTVVGDIVQQGTIVSMGFTLLALIGLTSLIITSSKMEKEPLTSYSVRTLSITILALLFYFIFSLNLPAESNPMDVFGVRLLMALTIGGTYTLICIGGGVWVKATINWLRKAKKIVTEWRSE